MVYFYIYYDYFNKVDIVELGIKFEYFVLLGFVEYFFNRGYIIKEMVWYISKNVGKIFIYFVFVYYFSNWIWVFYLYEDDNVILWGGWVFESEGKILFFVGDMGYLLYFKDIKVCFGEIDVCLLFIVFYFSEILFKWYCKVYIMLEDVIVVV